MPIKCELTTKISKSSGKEYQCIVIKLTDTYEKVVFLDEAEKELLQIVMNSKKN